MADLENSYDISTPGGDDDPREADDKMREIKAAVQERMNDHDSEPDEGDHFWPFDSVETTEVKDEDTGQHRKVTLRQMTDNPSDLTSYADTTNLGFLYQKDISSNGELFYQDEADRVIQVTDAGKLNIEDDAVDSDQIAAGAIDYAHMSANSINSAQYVDESIDVDHLSSGAITAGFDPTSQSGVDDSNGSVELPNGVVFKWGKLSGDPSWTSLTITTGFDDYCFQAVACSGSGGVTEGTTDYGLSVTDVTAANFKVKARIGGRLDPIRWIAIGR